MNNDTIKLIRKTSNVNSLMVIIFYMLDIALIRLGDLAVYHIAGKSAYYEDIAQLVSYCIQYLMVVPIVLVVYGRNVVISEELGVAKKRVLK